MSINKSEDHDMNRGVELMFRGRKKQKYPQKDENEKDLILKKSINFFGTNLIFHFQVTMKRNN